MTGNMPGELLKYSPALLYSNIAQLLNSTVETGLPLNSMGSGSLNPLQKPGKSRGPVAQLRPVVLLTALRKILSLIVLRRINKDVNNFVAHKQSGFRRSKSAKDVVWSYRWLAARCQRYRCALDILGIDMSKAFDCIRRPRLISVLGSFLQPDEIRMISFLLQDTVLHSYTDKKLNSKNEIAGLYNSILGNVSFRTQIINRKKTQFQI